MGKSAPRAGTAKATRTIALIDSLFMTHSPIQRSGKPRSIPGHHRSCVEPVIETDLLLPKVHADLEDTAVGGGQGAVAEADVVGFGLGGPIGGQRKLAAEAGRPAAAAGVGREAIRKRA